jgi:hypothetical protein
MYIFIFLSDAEVRTGGGKGKHLLWENIDSELSYLSEEGSCQVRIRFIEFKHLGT